MTCKEKWVGTGKEGRESDLGETVPDCPIDKKRMFIKMK